MLLKNTLKLMLLVTLIFSSVSIVNAQYLLNSDSAFNAGAANSGRLWGYMFGDYYVKTHSDALNRGGSNQYTGIPKDRNAFAFRRIYLGYDYNISKKFSAELLLAAEDNFPGFNGPTSSSTTGDELLNNKLTFYIKLANIRWKNIWKGTDFVFGQLSTPTFPLLTEKIWNYRSVERTITDIRRTPSYDFGGSLQGVFDPATKNFGYNVLIANGTSAKPASNSFKWLYGDVYAYLFDKKVVLDLYADYLRTNWSPIPSQERSRQMVKGYIAYNSAATAKGGMNPGQGYTVGVEVFANNLKNDLFATKIAGGVDTINNVATGASFYVHGDIIKNKLRFFTRVDLYNPMKKINNNVYKNYVGNTGNYNDDEFLLAYNNNGSPVSATKLGDETYKQTFFLAGLDYMPTKNVHLEPNIWYNHYATQLSGQSGAATGDHDMVLRLTFFYVFGK
ncbi:MAG: hypothetical protein KGO81_05260 [Bacteroidota bacterium]|nr:hypothetical protein [Bacteroidota bacterium]